MGSANSVSTKNTQNINYQREWKTNKTKPIRVTTRTFPQKGVYYEYNPECSSCNTYGCEPGECSAFTSWDRCDEGGAAPIRDALGNLYVPEGRDYTSYFEKCALTCPSKPICTRVNIADCWLGNSGGYDEPTYRADWDGDYNIKCTYDLDRIKTFEHVRAYKNKFDPKPDDDKWNEIMSNFCSQRTENCMIDPTVDKKITNCSLVTSLPDGGAATFCRAWFDAAPAGVRDNFIDGVCAANSDAAECKCHMRKYLPEYKKAFPYISEAVQDACVWSPCKGGSPAFLVNSVDSTPRCPENLCQIVYNIDAGGYVDIKNNQNWLMCTPKDPSNPDAPTTHKEPIPFIPTEYPPMVSPEDEKVKKLQTTGWYILGGCGLLLLAIIIALILLRHK